MRAHSNTLRSVLLLTLGLTLASGCVTRYKRWDPLSFADIPYTAPDGKPWPQHSLVVPTGTSPERVRVSYVELNPQGRQTLVFIHGLGSYLKFWRYQLDVFAAQGYRVIAVDLPGYGKSDKPASFPYTMEAMGEVVRGLLAALRVTKPILIGHSMGGHTSLSYAIRHPDEVAALVLVSPAGLEEFSRREKLWFEKAMTTQFIEEASEYEIWGAVRYGNFYRWKKEHEWLIQERVRLAKTGEFQSYAYANVRSVHGLSRNDFVRESAQHIKVPTLIVFGDMDRLIPNPFMHGGFTKWVMKPGHEKIAGSQLVELKKCGHTLQMDCPEEFNSTALGFLRSLPAAR